MDTPCLELRAPRASSHDIFGRDAVRTFIQHLVIRVRHVGGIIPWKLLCRAKRVGRPLGASYHSPFSCLTISGTMARANSFLPKVQGSSKMKLHRSIAHEQREKRALNMRVLAVQTFREGKSHSNMKTIHMLNTLLVQLFEVNLALAQFHVW